MKVTNLHNPYNTHHLWDERTLEAWKSMPVNANGHLLEPVEMHRHIWRAWFKRTPKDLWHPGIVQAYANLDRSKSNGTPNVDAALTRSAQARGERATGAAAETVRAGRPVSGDEGPARAAEA